MSRDRLQQPLSQTAYLLPILKDMMLSGGLLCCSPFSLEQKKGHLGVHLETNIFVAEMETGKKFCLQKQFPSEFKQHTLI